MAAFFRATVADEGTLGSATISQSSVLGATSFFFGYSALVRSTLLAVVEARIQTGTIHWGVSQSLPNVIVRTGTPLTLSTPLRPL
jgi:hypothetical protein